MKFIAIIIIPKTPIFQCLMTHMCPVFPACTPLNATLLQCVPTSILVMLHFFSFLIFNNLKQYNTKYVPLIFSTERYGTKNAFFSIMMISVMLQVHCLLCTYCSLWQSSLQALASTWTSPMWRQPTSHHSSKSHSQPCQAWQPSPSSSIIS